MDTEDIAHVLNPYKSGIVSAVLLGSRKGLAQKNSDIDLLVLTRNKSCWRSLRKSIKNLEQEHYLKKSNFAYFVEKCFLGSSSLEGIHLLLLNHDELGANFEPKSIRLWFLLLFVVSGSIFLHLIKKRYTLLTGKDILKQVTIPKLRFRDRYLTASLSTIILLIIPFIFFRRELFIMWCLKALKCYNTNLDAFLEISDMDTSKVVRPRINQKLAEIGKKYRYKPNTLHISRLYLYCIVWHAIVRNIDFYFFGIRISNER